MDTNIKPFFSIAIPTYGYNGKGTEFLEFSLERIYNQKFKDFEVVISDHSTDDTILKICKKWENSIQLKYLLNENGRGVISPNINNCLKHSNGKWIKILFQDDFLFNEESLEKQHNYIKEKNNVIWFFSDFYHSNTGNDFYKYYTPTWNDAIWTGYNTLGCPSGLTIKNEDVLFFDESLNWLMDCEYYHRMKLKYGVPNILSEVTVVNRTWGARLTDTISEEVKLKEFETLSKKYD